jgi:F-type H+-transporting ATPase subunit alpha
MVEQICVLLALTAGLLDPVPLDKMVEAQKALQNSAALLPSDLAERLSSADKLSEDDRKAILEVAHKALLVFLPKTAPKAK